MSDLDERTKRWIDEELAVEVVHAAARQPGPYRAQFSDVPEPEKFDGHPGVGRALTLSFIERDWSQHQDDRPVVLEVTWEVLFKYLDLLDLSCRTRRQRWHAKQIRRKYERAYRDNPESDGEVKERKRALAEAWDAVKAKWPK